MRLLPTIRCAAIAFFMLSLCSCLTRRTVTVGGQTVEDGYVMKRPIKEAIEKGRD